ncbi:MAG: hypothetical protein KBH93_11775 [Anaerolineae bacterium]|nr:hypothetical protein [Anaerolineae bacterium]
MFSRLKTTYAAYGLAITVGTIFTLANYTYGRFNQADHLLLVNRLLDPHYLSQDFFLNETLIFDPRANYAALLALMAHVIPLSAVTWALSLGTSCLTAVLTVAVAHDLFGDYVAGMLSVLLMGALGASLPGGVLGFYTSELVPRWLAQPLILLSVWASLRSQPVYVVAFCGLATIIHPQEGLVSGGIMLLALTLAERGFRREVRAAWLVYMVMALTVLVPYTAQPRISSDLFIELVAHIRNPHHLLVSTFSRQGLLIMGALVIAFFISWLRWQPSQPVRKKWLLWMGVGYVGLMIVAYLFVEVIPTRLGVTLQGFRYQWLLAWFSILFIAREFSRHRWLARVGAAFFAIAFAGTLYGPPPPSPDRVSVSAWVQKNTPPDAIFVIPPDWAEFRLDAERAVVEQFKTFPYQDENMLRWYERITDVYGDSITAMNMHYHGIDDARLCFLAEKYNATYAVLYHDTSSSLPVLYRNNEYRVVPLDGCASEP